MFSKSHQGAYGIGSGYGSCDPSGCDYVCCTDLSTKMVSNNVALINYDLLTLLCGSDKLTPPTPPQLSPH